MRLRLAAALVLALATAAPAQTADGIESTIRSQMDAFLADDFATAFTFASPTIKGVFGTPENFGAMVKQGYPMVHRPAEVRMLERRAVGGAMVQRVMVTDGAGNTHVLDYQMIETADGWQINGVQLLPGVGVGA
jgi:Domain of unknown function (DUF4864)